ncbi:YrbL family protein [Leclercia sp. UBA2479]|uniref:YrbL family protein n=1 Tax=Leclercia sp. UBA2479 TaxID=1946738 RepID=UPI002579E34E|nr:YrbL family protein [Leclercia sp. UBA2479]
MMMNLHKTIGRGRHRICYQHPQDSSKCIKILYNPDDGGVKEVRREVGYYRKRLTQIQHCRAIPDFHGKVETALGEGYVFDLIRDYDGEISKTLGHYIKNDLLSAEEIDNLLYELRNDLIAHRIATMNLKDYNILYRRTSEKDGYLVVIDNIGESEFIPVASLFSSLHRRKIDRIFARFMDTLPLAPACASRS